MLFYFFVSAAVPVQVQVTAGKDSTLTYLYYVSSSQTPLEIVQLDPVFSIVVLLKLRVSILVWDSRNEVLT